MCVSERDMPIWNWQLIWTQQLDHDTHSREHKPQPNPLPGNSAHAALQKAAPPHTDSCMESSLTSTAVGCSIRSLTCSCSMALLINLSVMERRDIPTPAISSKSRDCAGLLFRSHVYPCFSSHFYPCFGTHFHLYQVLQRFDKSDHDKICITLF